MGMQMTNGPLNANGPLMAILLDTGIIYSTIISVFPKLYNGMITLQPHHFLQTSRVCCFICIN